MALNSFDRNYGASLNAREFFFGNSGWFTIAIDMASIGAELGETASVEPVDSDAYATAKSAAEYNQFKIAELVGQRAVITATSDIRDTDAVPTFTGENVLNTTVAGTPAIGDSAISFLIERADVFTQQEAKPGAVNPGVYAVNPLDEMVAAITTDGFFRDTTGADVQAVDVQIAILNAFPPILTA
ncbi:hypothetical protein NVP2275O_487 [Vibrio phage 2.275.O._10N.286.54.E11]|nr:hypothetical protein NVP2275O_487 [Vibrio phage 2.275.O._10N.286.54.E11]